jgi:hypothetical protein
MRQTASIARWVSVGVTANDHTIGDRVGARPRLNLDRPEPRLHRYDERMGHGSTGTGHSRQSWWVKITASLLMASSAPPRPPLGQAALAAPRARAAIALTALVVGVHALLLALSIPDYRVSVDSGYHVSLARAYAQQGAVFWDPINFGPSGRPNLQGPALHAAIASLGRLLGGTGDAFVLANAVLAVVQWTAAMLTAWFFARRLGGDWAALFACALLAGNSLSSWMFAVGIPSGWTFILAPWAIHFFLEGRHVAAALATSLGIYFHLAGFVTVPAGVAIAALLTRRWRGLLIVGGLTALLTAPYAIHFAKHLGWFRGARGQAEASLAPIILLLALPGLVRMLRAPRQHLLLTAWAAAPAAWLLQNHIRFLGQIPLPAAVIAGVWLADVRARRSRPWRLALVAAAIVLTTIHWPLNGSSLRAEAAWLAGITYPRQADWADARALAAVLQEKGLTGRLVSTYGPTECVRIAAYVPIQIEKGHWVEVQPRRDPAERLSAGGKVYVLPLPPGDQALRQYEQRGWLTVHGGSAVSSIVTLSPAPPPAGDVLPAARAALVDESRWLAAHAVNNRMAPAGVTLQDWLGRMRTQRAHAGRLQVATILYAYATEPSNPRWAADLRGSARGFGSLANFLGDEGAIGWVREPRHERLRQHLAALADAAGHLGADADESRRQLGPALATLFTDYFTAD